MSLSSSGEAGGIIATNRFGLGARPDETLPSNPRAWLLAQFDRYQAMPAPWAALPHTPDIVLAMAVTQRGLRDAAEAERQELRQAQRRDAQDHYRDAVNARATSALLTATPVVERLVHFWSNHFAVSVEKPQVLALAGAFEAEAIRPHVLGRFEDMLLAAERHPAMLFYLDQLQSIGPDSLAEQKAARRQPDKKRGLNENLAREAMELHTLGVRSGYTQNDVTEFARALTGWGIGGLRPNPAESEPQGRFFFRTQLHEPGVRTILARRYDQEGEAQAVAILQDLARASATAHHVATKLACHFVADAPEPALVNRLAEAFLRSGGDLPAVYRVLFESPEAWRAPAAKFKTPWEWLISSLRGLGYEDDGRLMYAPLLNQLGQAVWRPGSPAGYDDTASAWAAPDALVRRVEMAQRLAARVGDKLDARVLAPKLLGEAAQASTLDAITHAESAQTALALLLVSPDFQRR
jgi:uncharacterized protein (DUF1800 family)